MGRRVDWTEAEHKAFAAKVFQNWKQTPFENLTTLGKQVMATDWPAERRRHINAIAPTGLAPTYRECCRLIREYLAHAEAAPTEVNTPPAPEFIYVDRPVAADPAAFMAAQPLETLLLELAHRLLRRWNTLDEIAETVRRIEAQAGNGAKHAAHHFSVPAPVPRAVPVARPPKPRIGIVGLFRDQFMHVQEKAGERAELVFLDKDLATANIPPTVTAVIVQKHSRHMWFDEAQKKCGNEHVHFVEGGQTAVVQKVYDLTSRQ
jgi:hypothetical protein